MVNLSPSEAAEPEEVVEPLSFDEAPAPDEQKLVQTLVNPMADSESVEFDVNLTDSVFLGQPMTPPDFDIGSINLDLGAESPAAAGDAESASEPEATFEQPVDHDGQWEEVNTKLDLAKAYEEMGDLEGARELLQEVLSEGAPDLVEKAQAILGRIGE
jgi:pilus assembly protein FimV